uniref:P12 n=1 Tax=Olive leaf mottling virus TaxID=3162628 RepID=A0AAU7NID3_9CLOS
MESVGNSTFIIFLSAFLFFLIALSIFTLFVCFTRMQFVKETEIIDENNLSYIQQTPLTKRLRRIMHIKDPQRHTPSSAIHLRSEMESDLERRSDRNTYGM